MNWTRSTSWKWSSEFAIYMLSSDVSTLVLIKRLDENLAKLAIRHIKLGGCATGCSNQVNATTSDNPLLWLQGRECAFKFRAGLILFERVRFS